MELLNAILCIAVIYAVARVFVWAARHERCSELMVHLKRVDVHDPSKRKADYRDIWFKENVNKLAKYKGTLEYIHRHGYLEDTFWKHVRDPKHNDRLQKNLIELGADVPNMVYRFIKDYDFLPYYRWNLLHNPWFKTRYWYVSGRYRDAIKIKTPSS